MAKTEVSEVAAKDRKLRVFRLVRLLLLNYAMCLVMIYVARTLGVTSWSYLGSTIWFLFALTCIAVHLAWIHKQPYLSKETARNQGYVGQSYWIVLFFWAALAMNEAREFVLFIGVMSLVYLTVFASFRASMLISVMASILYLTAASIGEHAFGHQGLRSVDFLWLTGFLMISLVCSLLAGNMSRQRMMVSRIKRQQLRQAQDLMIQSEKLASMGQMVASIGHEISNPISATQNATSIMEDNLNELESFSLSLFEEVNEDPDAKAVRDEMVRQFGALRSGIAISMQATEKLRDLSHALRTQSRMDNEMTPGVDLNQVIRESIIMVSGRTTTHQLEEALSDIPEIECMRSRIGQVITNLLANAADALTEQREKSGAGFRGKIAITSHVATNEETEGIAIIISDNGTGVPEAIRDKIFDEFFTTKPAGEGTGLGLAMCANIIRDHGGFLQVGDDPALGGARFEVWLPKVGTRTSAEASHLH